MNIQFLDGVSAENEEYINHNGMILRRVEGLNGEEYYQSLNGDFFKKVGGFFKKVGNGVVNVVSNIKGSNKSTTAQTNTTTAQSKGGVTSAQLLAMQNAQKKGLPTGAIIGIAAGGLVVVGILVAVLRK